MARAWKAEEQRIGMTGSMEAMLIEIYGCEFGVNDETGRDHAKDVKPRMGYSGANLNPMDALLVEIYGCAALEDPEGPRAARQAKVDFARYVRGMDESIIAIFGCIDGNRRVLMGNAVRERKRIKADFVRYVSGMEESIIKTYGCVGEGDRVVQLDAMRERRRLRQELPGDRVSTDVYAARVPRVMKR
jgi:hypothetical protein